MDAELDGEPDAADDVRSGGRVEADPPPIDHYDLALLRHAAKSITTAVMLLRHQTVVTARVTMFVTL